MAVPVKICGLTREEDIDAAIAGGAAYLGFIFYPPSRRCLTAERWRELCAHVAGRTPTVGVFVNPEDDWLEEIMGTGRLDVIQLHGKESPQRVAELATKSFLQDAPFKLVKAISVAEAGDLERVEDYREVVDMFMFDTKAPKQPGAIPGGNGMTFDWRLLAGREIPKPWFLAGGLSATNIRQAVELTGAPMVDLSSSVEDAPGIKNKELLANMLATAQNLGNA